jgi:hypothetical protein
MPFACEAKGVHDMTRPSPCAVSVSNQAAVVFELNFQTVL